MRLNFNVKMVGENRFKGVILKKQKEILFRSMVKMQEIATMKCPVDTGRLRSSINLDPIFLGAWNYTLSVGVDYGIDVEYGTSPHMVPVKELEGWSRRVLGSADAAFPVALKIAERGTPAQPFFRPSYDEVINIWLPSIKNSVMANSQ